MINYYRLDEKNFNGINGGKAEIAYEICKNSNGIVTCGSRESIQVLTFSKMCDIMKIPCFIHIPQGKETNVLKELKNTNANIIYEKVGYNNVLNSHAKQNADKIGYKFIPLGMVGCKEANKIIMQNTEKLLNNFSNTKRIVTVIGSGTTFIGICNYCCYFSCVICGVQLCADKSCTYILRSARRTCNIIFIRVCRTNRA